ncbi:MAG: hypothetical protein ACYCTE_08180 [Acidimicrobiales bacterium]
MSDECFELRTERLGCLPVLDHFLARMGFVARLGRFLPADDPRLRLAPGAVCDVVVRNIVERHRPLYALREWAAPRNLSSLNWLILMKGTHADRVGDLAGLVARELDLDKAERPLVARVRAVHDLGKFGLSPAVLTKPGPLSQRSGRRCSATR